MTRARVAALLLVALSGCASSPEAPPDRDADAKRFAPEPGVAALYVFRNDTPRTMDADDSVLFVNERLIGATLPRTYFRVDLRPGGYELRGYGHDQGSLRIQARGGEAQFVALNVVGGTSYFAPVTPETGRREIARCCALMENWAPGQRPLLR